MWLEEILKRSKMVGTGTAAIIYLIRQRYSCAGVEVEIVRLLASPREEL
jgi:hypothetical protein